MRTQILLGLEMKSTIFCFLLCLMHRSVLADKEVSCESIGYGYWGGYWGSIGTQNTCYMTGSTTIDSTRFTISTYDATVGALSFNNNKKIRFLPEYSARKFPNLVVYSAWACSIKNVFKANFKNLSKLRYLSLSTNQLEKIESDTFEDLILLDTLNLESNRIKFMNGAAFSGLSKLTKVIIGGNICIDENFSTPTQIASMPRTVTEKCGFNEASNMKVCADQVNEIAELVKNNEMHQTLEKKLTETTRSLLAAGRQESATLQSSVDALKNEVLFEMRKKSVLNEQCHTKGQKLAEEKENLVKERRECEVEKLNFRNELRVKSNENEVCKNFEKKLIDTTSNLLVVSQQSATTQLSVDALKLEMQEKNILHEQCHTKGQKLAEEKENLVKGKRECEVEKLNFRNELRAKTSENEVCKNFEKKFNELSRNLQDLSFLRDKIELLKQKTSK